MTEPDPIRCYFPFRFIGLLIYWKASGEVGLSFEAVHVAVGTASTFEEAEALVAMAAKPISEAFGQKVRALYRMRRDTEPPVGRLSHTYLSDRERLVERITIAAQTYAEARGERLEIY